MLMMRDSMIIGTIGIIMLTMRDSMIIGAIGIIKLIIIGQVHITGHDVTSNG